MEPVWIWLPPDRTTANAKFGPKWEEAVILEKKDFSDHVYRCRRTNKSKKRSCVNVKHIKRRDTTKPPLPIQPEPQEEEQVQEEETGQADETPQPGLPAEKPQTKRRNERIPEEAPPLSLEEERRKDGMITRSRARNIRQQQERVASAENMLDYELLAAAAVKVENFDLAKHYVMMQRWEQEFIRQANAMKAGEYIPLHTFGTGRAPMPSSQPARGGGAAGAPITPPPSPPPPSPPSPLPPPTPPPTPPPSPPPSPPPADV